MISENVFNKLYPVGAVYQTINASFNPNKDFTGTWERIENGLFLQASDSNAGEKVNAGVPTASGQFGAAMLINGRQSGVAVLLGNNKMVFQGGTEVAVISDTVSFEIGRNNSIFGKSDTVQPPAIKVFMWKRTA